MKNLAKQSVVGAGIVIISFAFIVAFFMSYWGVANSYLLSGDSLIAEVETGRQSAEIAFGLPIRLRIPKINVDAAFVNVALTADGAMDVPKTPSEVAWFNLSSRPGDRGSAVVSGHYGWKNGIPAVFDDLDKLKKGDVINVEDKRGLITTFAVRESRIYDWDADAPDVFGSSDGGAHLNLITCGGIWDKINKNYSTRLVVFADKE